MYNAVGNFEQKELTDPQVASLVPPVLTCLVSRRLGSDQHPLAQYELRNLAASLLGSVAKKYSKSSHMLKPRLARSFLKHFLDPTKTLGANYGGIVGLQAIGGSELVRNLILHNLREFESLIREPIEEDQANKAEAEMVAGALMKALHILEKDSVVMMNGNSLGNRDEVKAELEAKIGGLLTGKVLELDNPRLVKSILQAQS